MMHYKGTPIIVEPRSFDINDTNSITYYVGVNIAIYIQNHIVLDTPMSIENITCKFVDLDEIELSEIIQFNKRPENKYKFSYNNDVLDYRQAYEYAKNNYKKLLLSCEVK